jgi:DNA helicase TIP49 (TBP-interacting protein)
MQIACIRGSCYRYAMGVHLQIRDLPDELHEILRRRAAMRELSLRQYALEVLQEHCRQPTLDEWLEGLSRLTPVALSTPASEAVREARDAEDGALIDALGRP